MIVVVLVHNEIDMTRAFVDSVVKSKDNKEGVKVVMVNNGSTDKVVGEWLSQLAKDNKLFNYRENKVNKMFTLACAEVVAEYPGEDVYFLNNDILVEDGWLSGRECLNEWAMVGATQVYPAEREFITFAGGKSDFCSHESMWKWAYKGYCEAKGVDKNGVYPVKWLTFGACMVQRRAYEAVGGLDLGFRFYCSDSDLSLTMVKHGYKIGVKSDMVVAHWGSITTQKAGNDVMRNEGYQDQLEFAEKWGVDVGGHKQMFKPYEYDKRKEWFTEYFTQAPQIKERNKFLAKRSADKIERMLGRGKILELGCVWGFNVMELRERGIEAYGLELSDVVKEAGKEWLMQADLEAGCLPADGFDGICSSAVLEHVKRDLLPAMYKALNKGGLMYHEIDTQIGIDKTHVNVKPVDTWLTDIKSAGFDIVSHKVSANGMLSVLARKVG